MTHFSSYLIFVTYLIRFARSLQCNIHLVRGLWDSGLKQQRWRKAGIAGEGRTVTAHRGVGGIICSEAITRVLTRAYFRH